jgi:Tol biopolymer transport system component
MKRLIGLMILLLAAFYVGWPAWSGYQLKAALDRKDVETVGRKIDFPSVRQSLEPVVTREVGAGIQLSPNVSSVAQVTKLEGAKVPGAFSVAPDGETLVFQALELQPRVLINLWSTSTRGTGGLSRITAGHYLDSGPSFSNDGARVYFASNRNSVLPRIWSIKSTGAGGISMLTQGDSWDGLPCADVKNGRVFYASSPRFSSSSQIWSIALDGGLPTQLAEGEYPRVSPDGQWLLYSQSDPDTRKRKIWKMKADGVSPTQLTTSTDSDDVQASWSPDGKYIVFSSDMSKDSNGNKNFDIWVMRASASPAFLSATGRASSRMAPGMAWKRKPAPTQSQGRLIADSGIRLAEFANAVIVHGAEEIIEEFSDGDVETN